MNKKHVYFNTCKVNSVFKPFTSHYWLLRHAMFFALSSFVWKSTWHLLDNKNLRSSISRYLDAFWGGLFTEQNQLQGSKPHRSKQVNRPSHRNKMLQSQYLTFLVKTLYRQIFDRAKPGSGWLQKGKLDKIVTVSHWGQHVCFLCSSDIRGKREQWGCGSLWAAARHPDTLHPRHPGGMEQGGTRWPACGALRLPILWVREDEREKRQRDRKQNDDSVKPERTSGALLLQVPLGVLLSSSCMGRGRTYVSRLHTSHQTLPLLQ